MIMVSTRNSDVSIEEIRITGYVQPIILRSYQPASDSAAFPVVLYFHGGAFTGGSLDDAGITAMTVACRTRAWVVSVGYSLAPQFPFPVAPEDGYRALKWAVSGTGSHRVASRLVGIAGHDAGGNLATCVAAIARDRGEVTISAQVLIAPLLDPSMTRMGSESGIVEAKDMSELARCYRAYLPSPTQHFHPYAAPLDSRRLHGLQPALIVTAMQDRLRREAEKYAIALINAGVSTQVIDQADASHDELASHPAVLADVISFLKKHLHAPTVVKRP